MNEKHDKTINSRKIQPDCRSHSIEVIESVEGRRYLCISELRRVGAKQELNRVLVSEEQVNRFHDAYLKAIEKVRQPKKAYSISEMRRQLPNAYKKWTSQEEDKLRTKFNQGVKIEELADLLQRKPSAIESRLKKLDLLK